MDISYPFQAESVEFLFCKRSLEFINLFIAAMAFFKKLNVSLLYLSIKKFGCVF